MEKAEKQVLKALKGRPISKKEYEKLKQDRAKMEKWVSDLRKNYPGIMCETKDGITVYGWDCG